MQKQFATMRPSADLPQITALLTGERSAPKSGTPYDIQAISASEAEVTIYDLIGWEGVTAGEFVKELNAIKASKITLRINSEGGLVSDGIAIFNAIKRHPANVHAYVDSMAASCASFIALAGDVVTMMPRSRMMIHDAFMVAGGPADFLRQQAALLDKESNNIAAIYADRAGGTVEEWRARMKDETWFSDREAVEAGLADNVDGVEIEDRAEIVVKATVEPSVVLDEPEPEPEAVENTKRFTGFFDELKNEYEDDIYAGVTA